MQLLQFPFHYQDSITDTFQKVGGVQNLQSLIYDGYGTLILPYNTFYNLVRVKSVRPSNVVYHWYNLNPIADVLSYNVTANSLTATDPSLAAIQSFNTQNSIFQIFPNPATTVLNVELKMLNEPTQLKLFDVNGKLVLMQTINGNATIDASTLSNGIYNACITNNNGVVNKKVVIVR